MSDHEKMIEELKKKGDQNNNSDSDDHDKKGENHVENFINENCKFICDDPKKHPFFDAAHPGSIIHERIANEI